MAALTDVQMERQIAQETAAATTTASTTPAPTMQAVPGASNVSGSIAALNSNIAAQQNYTAGSDTGLNAALAGVNSQIAATQAGINQVAASSPAQGSVVGTPVTDPITGNTTTTYSTGLGGTYTMTAPATTTTASSSQDAWAIVSAAISSWFGGDATSTAAASAFIKQEMLNNIGPQQALVDMRQQSFYQTRFAGNTARAAAGLNVLSEADYLSLENQYSSLFKSYGVGDGSATNLATKQQFATLIGNDVSATELNTRLDLAVNQVQNADPTVMATLQQFYPGVSTSGLMAYFLNPTEALPMLQQQTTAAEIGAAAVKTGLTTDLASATALAKYGVTQAQAQTGYQKIAEELPAATKLSQIYGAQTGINYTQATGEQQYLENSGTAALQQQQLTLAEQAQFSGKSGLNQNVQTLKPSMQGKF